MIVSFVFITKCNLIVFEFSISSWNIVWQKKRFKREKWEEICDQVGVLFHSIYLFIFDWKTLKHKLDGSYHRTRLRRRDHIETIVYLLCSSLNIKKFMYKRVGWQSSIRLMPVLLLLLVFLRQSLFMCDDRNTQVNEGRNETTQKKPHQYSTIDHIYTDFNECTLTHARTSHFVYSKSSRITNQHSLWVILFLRKDNLISNY